MSFYHLFFSASGCATQGEIQALRDESHKEWSTIQMALAERINQTHCQLDTQKKALEDQQHVLSELKNQILAAADLQTKLEMQRHGTARQVVQET